MDANQAPRMTVEPDRLGPIVLRLLLLLGATAVAFILGTTAAHADDDSAETPPEATAHQSGDPASLLPSDEPAPAPAEQAPATHEPSADQGEEPLIEPQVPAEPDPDGSTEPEKAQVVPTETTAVTLPESKESRVKQGNFPAAVLTESVSREVTRTVAPVVRDIETTTVRLSRAVESAVGKKSVVAKALSDVNGTVAQVTTVLEESIRPVQTAITQLSSSLRPAADPRSQDRPVVQSPPDGDITIARDSLSRGSDRVDQRRPLMRGVPAQRRVSSFSLVTPRAVNQPAIVPESAVAPASGAINEIGVDAPATCSAPTSGGSSSGVAPGAATLVPSFIHTHCVTDALASGDAHCPPSVGCQPGVAPD